MEYEYPKTDTEVIESLKYLGLSNIQPYQIRHIQVIILNAIKSERDACAQIADNFYFSYSDSALERDNEIIARRIRARL